MFAVSDYAGWFVRKGQYFWRWLY